MTNEEKQILLKDLCMRLPYGVKVKSSRRREPVPLSLGVMTDFYIGCSVKPYLRPMSSMTEKEQKEFDAFCVIDELVWKGDNLQGYINQAEIMRNGVNWLNTNHFDYSGLIPMGLALKAKEGMYN